MGDDGGGDGGCRGMAIRIAGWTDGPPDHHLAPPRAAPGTLAIQLTSR